MLNIELYYIIGKVRYFSQNITLYINNVNINDVYDVQVIEISRFNY